jgi:16S rRNA (cytidine1402-2'-O)-methyltransferase
MLKGPNVGKIILLNTPIGNLGDLTPRVLEALQIGETFAVEDTRVFKDLLNHLGISLTGKQIYSLHDQSEDIQIKKLIDLARERTLYLASEAGSPIVSDPAYPLLKAAYEAGLEVDSYSGVSSPIMALELSGLPPIPFDFQGFLPREALKKATLWKELSYGTHIFFEAPTRIEETLDQMSQENPELQVALVRELSKKFQQVERFIARDWGLVKSKVMFKGEFVLVVYNPNASSGQQHHQLKKLAEDILNQGATPKNVAKLLGEILDRSSKDIYAQMVKPER